MFLSALLHTLARVCAIWRLCVNVRCGARLHASPPPSLHGSTLKKSILSGSERGSLSRIRGSVGCRWVTLWPHRRSLAEPGPVWRGDRAGKRLACHAELPRTVCFGVTAEGVSSAGFLNRANPPIDTLMLLQHVISTRGAGTSRLPPRCLYRSCQVVETLPVLLLHTRGDGEGPEARPGQVVTSGFHS